MDLSIIFEKMVDSAVFLAFWAFSTSEQSPPVPYWNRYKPRRQKTGLRGFRPGPTQTRLGNHRRWLETWNFGFRKQRHCTIQVAKTKALISFGGYREADLRLCFRICENPVFSRRGSYKPCNEKSSCLFEPQHEKTNNVDSDRVWHKPGCAATGYG